MSGEPVTRRAAVDVLLRCSSAALVLGLSPLVGCADDDPSLIVDLDRVPAGSALMATFRDKPVMVLNVGGSVRAFSGLCTHEGCELGWNPRQQLIRCPCHGSAFDTAGQVTRGPAKDPLPEFRTRLRDGKVLVRIP